MCVRDAVVMMIMSMMNTWLKLQLEFGVTSAISGPDFGDKPDCGDKPVPRDRLPLFLFCCAVRGQEQ